MRTLALALLLSSGHAAAQEAYLSRGLSLARMGKLPEAEAVLRDGRRSFPHDKRFALELAGLAYRTRHRAAAKRHLHQALRLDPGDPYGNEFLGSLYLLDGNLEAALQYWNRLDKPLIDGLRFTPAPPLEPVLRDRAFAISAGQILTVGRLRATEANLNRLDVLAWYRFNLTPAEDNRFDLTFQSLETVNPLRGWLGRVLPYLRGLPYQTVNADFLNLRQQALHVRSLWRWDPEKRRVAIDVSGPIRLDPRRRFRFILDVRSENWDLGTNYVHLQKIESGAEVEFALTDALAWTTGLRAARRRFRGGHSDTLFANSWLFEQRNAFDYALWRWPERRLRLDASALLRTGRVFADAPSRFVSVTGGVSGRWLPESSGDKLTVNAHVRAGRTFGSAPIDELFMLGMERDNDLWLRGHVGTRDGRKGNAPMGKSFTLIQTGIDREVFRLPFVSLAAGPFFDTGRVPARGWMHDTGVQLKVKTMGRMTWSLVYGRDLRDGRGVFYTAVTR